MRGAAQGESITLVVVVGKWGLISLRVRRKTMLVEVGDGEQADESGGFWKKKKAVKCARASQVRRGKNIWR